MKKIYFLLFSLITLLTACQKEAGRQDNNTTVVPPPNQLDDSCRIQRAYYYGGSGGINDSADFFYTANKLMTVTSESADVHYTYNGDRLFSMSYFEKPGNLLYHIDTFHYLDDTTLAQIISHDFDMYNHMDTVHSVINFIYSNSVLSQLVTVDRYEGFPDTDTLTSDFRWENGNVRSILFHSSYWADDSIYYDYDTNPNYFNASSRYFFMADPFFQIHVGFDPHLPYFISRNNVTNFTIYTNIDYPITYETDSLNHPTMVRQGGFDYMQYEWDCP